ncbi:unnamed protein product [Rotaria sordida]|uniref:Uncharacterized protein n=2 Tax=Rotaria sordida TaxID=392033 RepID=A0A820B1M7_9BILA|nr:unnamed protein product [Rotaria sordida]CAF4195716.1 unnamed protein product [Rotaria sordida]
MMDMFYSLVDVNQRFNRLAFDSLCIHHLNFAIKHFDIHQYATYNDILDRICSKILPRINDKVNKLTVDPLSMEQILCAVHYPQLHSLSLINYQPEILSQHLSNNDTLYHLLSKQITHLTVNIYSKKEEISNGKKRNMLPLILFIGHKLSDLTFLQEMQTKYITISYLNTSHIKCLSSTVTKLRVNVNTFDDCLYLLNGSIKSLSTLIIRIYKIKRSSSKIDNTKKLVKLKCFALTTNWRTYYYDEQVVPLLRRMLNLEELTLHLSVIKNQSTYIDGNQLYDDFLNYMSQLNKFIFNIHTHIVNNSININLPSNDDIRKSFIKRGFYSIDIYADDKLINNRGNCHVYSLPYQFNEFLYMSSCFQGGKFDKVRMLFMRDERPFQYKLFQIISQDFPFLQKLTIFNLQSQENEQHHSSILIIFNHLLTLDLSNAHNDYVIQFLSERITCLRCLSHLIIKYETLTTVTNYFTNDSTRFNCSKIKSLGICGPFVRSQNFNSYFPFL